MNWFKFSKDFSYRNVINDKIKYLSELASILEKNKKLVFQSSSIVKHSNFNVIDSKKITSYPDIRDILIEADGIIFDSPWKYASLCNFALEKIYYQIDDFKKERKLWTMNKGNEIQKGWVDEY